MPKQLKKGQLLDKKKRQSKLIVVKIFVWMVGTY